MFATTRPVPIASRVPTMCPTVVASLLGSNAMALVSWGGPFGSLPVAGRGAWARGTVVAGTGTWFWSSWVVGGASLGWDILGWLVVVVVVVVDLVVVRRLRWCSVAGVVSPPCEFLGFPGGRIVGRWSPVC